MSEASMSAGQCCGRNLQRGHAAEDRSDGSQGDARLSGQSTRCLTVHLACALMLGSTASSSPSTKCKMQTHIQCAMAFDELALTTYMYMLLAWEALVWLLLSLSAEQCIGSAVLLSLYVITSICAYSPTVCCFVM